MVIIVYKIFETEKLERSIANANNKLYKHNRKWNAVLYSQIYKT